MAGVTSDPGEERVKDVEAAFRVVAKITDGDCPDTEEADDPRPMTSCDKCMAKLVANAISDRRAEATDLLAQVAREYRAASIASADDWNAASPEARVKMMRRAQSAKTALDSVLSNYPLSGSREETRPVDVNLHEECAGHGCLNCGNTGAAQDDRRAP